MNEEINNICENEEGNDMNEEKSGDRFGLGCFVGGIAVLGCMFTYKKVIKPIKEKVKNRKANLKKVNSDIYNDEDIIVDESDEE